MDELANTEIEHQSNTQVETAFTFGEQKNLVGVYTPASSISGKQPNSDKPCAIYVSAGFLHQIGPSRLHVEMARALSQEGIAGFRFDLSGVGDSESRGSAGYFTERSVNEIIQTIDMLNADKQHQQFVLIGLCSGADDALATALMDSRVSGLVLMNGYSYRAGWFHLHRWRKFYIPRMFKPAKLINLFKKLFHRIVSSLSNSFVNNNTAAADNKALADLDEDYRYVPPREETQEQLRVLCEQKVHLLSIFTGSEHDDYTYGNQFFAMFPKLRGSKHVSVRYFELTDHTFTLREDRDQLIAWVSQWYRHTVFDRD